MRPTYDFDASMFTPVFWKLREASTRFVVNFGSAGSGKSWAQAEHEIIRALEEPQRIAICRKHQTTIQKSVWQLVRNSLLIKWGIPFTENKTERQIFFNNGSELLFLGLDDPEKMKSIENVKRIWIEEATQCYETDLDQMNLRLRGSKGAQISLTFNPVSKHHWLKEYFFGNFDFQSPREDTTVIHSNYTENPHLDEDYIAQLERYRVTDEEHFKIYGLGHWGEPRSGYEFYKDFDGSEIMDLEWDRNLPLHISLDFNVLPYMTLTIYQVEEDQDNETTEIRQIDEICATDPHNNTVDLARLFANRYAENTQKIHLYGDPSGKAQSTKTRGEKHEFDIFKRQLQGWEIVDRVLNTPPDIKSRGDFANSIFRGEGGITFKIDRNCSYSIEDFQTVKETLDNKKEKKKEKDPKSGLKMEMRGHTSDSFDYFVCSALRDQFYRFVYGEPIHRTVGRSRQLGKHKM